jgi:hypothetical protein
MATKASAFQTATDHLHLGIRLLGQRNWRDQCYLSLDMYMAAAEVEVRTVAAYSPVVTKAGRFIRLRLCSSYLILLVDTFR